MAISSKIKIMISSRCNDRFPLAGENSRPLSEIRVQLKREIESVTIFKQAIYDVWINEKVKGCDRRHIPRGIKSRQARNRRVTFMGAGGAGVGNAEGRQRER